MAYQVTVGNSITIRHPVRTPAGVLKTGEAANIITALEDGSGVSSALPVTVNEIVATGWYSLALSPNAAGNWLLTVTNPSGTDEAVTEYVISVTVGTVASANAAKNLTTTAKVKEWLYAGQSPVPTKHDSLIADLILEVSAEITDKLGRCPLEDTYTEYVDGRSTRLLRLAQGPIASITSVQHIEYGGTTDRTETPTTVQEAEFLEHGLRAEGFLGLGTLERLNGLWSQGRRNYKIVYVAGFDTIPDNLVLAATQRVVSRFFGRETQGQSSKIIGDAQQNLLSPDQEDRALDRILRPYKSWGIA